MRRYRLITYGIASGLHVGTSPAMPLRAALRRARNTRHIVDLVVPVRVAGIDARIPEIVVDTDPVPE